MKKIAIVGTNGIPAKYGGFETLAEYLSEYLSCDFEITVFCSANSSTNRIHRYKGVKLVYINLNANGWQSVIYDFISIIKSFRKYDKILILGSSGGLFMPLFRGYKHKFILNIGGLDWRRGKWNFFAKKYLKISEWLSVISCEHIVSDNLGIRDYLLKEYCVSSSLISYGGDQVERVSINDSFRLKYSFVSKPYALAIARVQPDNNIGMLCESFDMHSKFPLVIVGNWGISKFGKELKKKYLDKPNIILLDAIYDQCDLNLLRSNCYIYLHGHSAGGTNPALVEAMHLRVPIFAYDNYFNNCTTLGKAFYFDSSSSLKSRLQTITDEELKINADEMYMIALKKYKWSIICSEYAMIFNT
jgi:hypothetical protein